MVAVVDDVPEDHLVLGTMWSPKEGYQRGRPFLDCLAAEVGHPIGLVQRRTYAQSTAELLEGTGDIGLICTGATAAPALREHFRAPFALASARGPSYRGVVVVAADSSIDSLVDLKGVAVAYVDPDSLTGFRAVRARLRDAGHEPDVFFGPAIFTFSHDRSIEDVAAGIVAAAPVDEEILERHPRRDEVRAVWQSDSFPSPPVLVRKGRTDLLEALSRLVDRAECVEPLGARGLAPTSWAPYDEVARVIEQGR